MHLRRTLLLSLVLVPGLCPLFGASPETTITYSITGTLGSTLR